jgi:hypothetical protein
MDCFCSWSKRTYLAKSEGVVRRSASLIIGLFVVTAVALYLSVAYSSIAESVLEGVALASNECRSFFRCWNQEGCNVLGWLIWVQ